LLLLFSFSDNIWKQAGFDLDTGTCKRYSPRKSTLFLHLSKNWGTFHK